MLAARVLLKSVTILKVKKAYAATHYAQVAHFRPVSDDFDLLELVLAQAQLHKENPVLIE